MRTGITFDVTPADRVRLEAIVAAGSSPQKHVWRARSILMSGDGFGTVAIMEETGKSKTCVWRWQERFMSEGVDGLLRDKSRPPGIAPLGDELVESSSYSSSTISVVRSRKLWVRFGAMMPNSA